ncbi:MAG: hypothetical protein ABR498_05745 [Candidatus Dormibacteria bacterium]
MFRFRKGLAGVALAPLCAALPALLQPSHAAAASPPVTTTASNVRSLTAPSGGAAMYSAVMQHDAAGTTGGPGTLLPGAVIPRSSLDPSDSGAWDSDGALGAWLAPGGSFGFDTSLGTVENGYFLDDIDSTTGQPLHAGDSTQLATAGVRYDNPLPWDRARGPAGGSLKWELTEDFRHVNATYSGVSGSTDAVLFRADLFATGGDVDARSNAMQAPVLTIPLPQQYPTVTSAPYIAAEFLPTTDYLSQLTMRVAPEVGTAALTGSLRGYLPAASAVTLASGGVIREWHLSLTGVIVIPASTAGPAPVLSVRGAHGGTALVNTDGSPRSVSLDGADGVMAARGMQPRLLDVSRGSASSAPAPAGQESLTSEMRAADAVNHTLAVPVDLSLGERRFNVTLDPNAARSGTLAVGSLQRTTDGASYFTAAGAPYAFVNGATVPLTRDRLTDLRVSPLTDGFSVGFKGLSGTSTPSDVLSVYGVVAVPGATVTAVYDLGASVYDFVSFQALPPPFFSDDSITIESEIVSLNSVPVTSSNLQYETVPEGAPLSDGTTSFSNEFSEPFDAANGTILSAGAHTIVASIATGGGSGQLTVKAGGASIAATPPAADSSVPLGAGPFTMYYTSPSGLAAHNVTFSVVNIALGAPTPAPSPPPLGQLCGAPQMTESDANASAPDAPADLDIERAWFGADAANVYATLQVHNVPTAAPPQTSYQWSVSWRAEHAGNYGRATLDSNGVWSFDLGYTSAMSGALGTLHPATGDVHPGADGVIRVAIPRALFDFRDGALLRDTAAQSWLVTAATTQLVDTAPEGAATGWGNGGDYTVAACSSLGTALPEAGPLPASGFVVTMVLGLTLLPRVRRLRHRVH